MTPQDPDALNRFVGEVASELAALGLQRAAKRLVAIQGTAYTTGSEWLGELGTAVRDIRGQYPIPPALDTRLERIMTEVRRAWPAL